MMPHVSAIYCSQFHAFPDILGLGISTERNTLDMYFQAHGFF